MTKSIWEMKAIRLITAALFFSMSLLMTLPIQAASPKSGWQEVTSEEITLSNGQNTTRLPSTVKSGDPIEVYSNDGFIYIRTPKRVQVQVFTILGQLVSQAYINPVTSQLKIETRGIYIVKVGSVTQKVAL